MRNTSPGLILAASALTLCCIAHEPRGIAAAPADAAHPPGAMTVTGTATLEVSPDCLDLTMTIIADGDRPGLATKALRAEQAAVIAALAKIGVAGNDLKLSLLTLNPIYDPSPSGWAQLHVHTYRAEITLTATTHRFDKLGDMMDAGATAGVSRMSSAFRRSDLPELKKKVRDLAVVAARAKAKQLTDAAGVKLGRIVSIAEAPSGAMWGSAYFPQVSNSVEVSNTSGGALGGSLQALTLDITLGYELAPS